MRAHSRRILDMKKALIALVALTVGGGACDFKISDPNSPPSIGPNATAATVNSATLGLLIALREDIPNWVQKSSILGREGYRLDTADPRFISELLQGPLDPSNNAFGGGQWTREMRTIQGGYAILNVISTAQITDAEKEGVRGFVQTIQALAFLMVLNAHIQDSIPIDVNRSIDQPLAPFVSNDSAYKHVSLKLDSARTHLLAAGPAFVFDPGPGFTGFNTPATFLEVNRALKARVMAYRASLGALPPGTYTSPAASWSACTVCWDSVITVLSPGQSFLDTTAALDEGAYMAFGTGNQDTPNALSQNPQSAVNLAHPFIRDSAETQSGSALLDKRYIAKVTQRVPPLSLSGHTSNISWLRYPTPISPIPIIRNEELILLWAEARLGQGNNPEAARFINFIRRASGGLDSVTNLGAQPAATILNQLLKQRLYSLLYENGHRWIDMRRYGKLGQIIIDVPAKDKVFSSMPINVFEVNARQ